MSRDPETLLTGDIKKNLLAMSLPTMIGFVLQSVYDMVDLFWIGRFSSEAVAGVTVFTSIFWFVYVLNEIIGTSSISMITQSYSKRDKTLTEAIVEQTISFKIFVAIIAAVTTLTLLDPALRFFSDDPVVINAAKEYGKYRLYFLPIFFASYSVNTALRAIGDPKTPMYFMIGSGILNMILDPLLMFDIIPYINLPGLGLGIAGAAIATVISTTLAFAVGLILLLRGNYPIKISIRGLFSLKPQIDKKLLTIGLPSGVENLTRSLASFLMLKLVSSYGTMAIAIAGINARLLNFVFMPAFGFVMGASTIIGQNLGVNQVDRAEETVNSAIQFNLIIMGVAGVFSLLFPELVMKFFIDDGATIALGIPMVRWLAPTFIFGSINIATSSAFTGSGYNRPMFIVSFVGRWLVELPMMYVATNVLQLPLRWFWIAIATGELISCIVSRILYHKTPWRINRVA